MTNCFFHSIVLPNKNMQVYPYGKAMFLIMYEIAF